MRDKRTEDIIKKQRQFFQTGTPKSYGFRMAALKRLERALKEYEEKLLKSLKADLNKSPAEAYMAEIGLTRAELSFVKKQLHRWMRPERAATPVTHFPAESYILKEPYGVTLIMAPWNYPVLLCLDPLIDAIGAGNCVILKPSAYAPAVSAVLKEMLESIYPEKYVAVIEGGRAANEALLEQRFDKIFFTGSVDVGRLVMEKAAENLTPVTLELGGKSPCIVDETASLGLAARRIAFGKLLNCGQTCVAPDYLLVHRKVKHTFLACLKRELIRMAGEDAFQNPDYPKMINEKHYERVKSLIEGEKVYYGGKCLKKTLQIEPTVLDEVTMDSPVMKEEIFGPLLPVLTYETKEELEAVISRFEKPLAFYLFTENKGMEAWAFRHFSFGGGCINDTVLHLATPHMPFGGVGGSGMGGYHGKAGFDTFSHRKSVVKKSGWFDNPLRYAPYREWKDKAVRLFLR